MSHLYRKGTSGKRTKKQAGKGVVKREQLKDVAKGDSWRVNNLMDRQHQHRDANVIVEEALRLVGTQLQYNLISFNCEHFATYLRYGRARSGQVSLPCVWCVYSVYSVVTTGEGCL